MVGLEAMVTYPGIGFLLNPVFLRAFSASLHLVLLLLLFVSWVCKRINGGALENCKRTRNGWSGEKLVTLLDLVLRTLSWGAVSVYLHTQFHGSVEPKFPFLLRVWWGFYFSISCYCLVIDIVKKDQSLQVQFLVPDIVYVITGLFLCYSGFLGKNQGEESILREPLLNGGTSISIVESDESKGEETVTPFQKLLDTSNSVVAVFPAFRISSSVIVVEDQSSNDHNDLQQGFDSFLPVKAGPYYWEIINFMSVDAERIGDFICCSFLCNYNCYVGKCSTGEMGREVSGQVNGIKDKRMKATSEILRNMRILKLQGWEMKFLSKIVDLRKNETGWILQQPIYLLPDLISMIVQTKVSLDRITSFLRLVDLQSDVIERLPKGSSDTAIEIVDGNFSWDLSSPNPTLKDINLRVCRGMRVAVCGTVGSGKSSLLSCMLGEVPKISGILKLCGTKAYVAQSPWIQSGKIEENILFGERGINLSGGQKQRIQIARALYQNADIYLFDDPFSAVDAHTGTHLFKKALSALNSVEAGSLSEKLSIHEDSDNIGGTSEVVEKEENSGGQNGKAEEIDGPKGQLVQEEEREKDSLSAASNWKQLLDGLGKSVSDDVKPAVRAGYKTATILFNKMHLCVFRAPMSFFDATPSGRILNRASTDQSTIDTNIATQVGACAFQLIQLLGIIAVMSQVAWQVFIVFIPVAATCIWYQLTSPHVSHITLFIFFAYTCHVLFQIRLSSYLAVKMPVGSMTIRSFDQESRFRDTNMKLIDGYIRPKFSIAGAIEWLCFRLDMLSSVTFAFSLVFLISVPEGVIDPGLAGLTVTYGLNLNMILAWVIWNFCNMENIIISVERILQYTSIPSEPPLVIEENRPACSWPSHGQVDIQDLQVRYAPHMPLVLRGLTCTFLGGMKTGIVGRTGSGKSTLIQTLFRIVEPAAGQITIDGTNISSIGLHDLRSRLSIIPQDPTMFEGTVRSNLDPLEEYSDEQIWEVGFVILLIYSKTLDKCQLGDEVRKKEGKLDSAVTENGENWSMGQRQLVCLGRVLLKKSKVLVLDEATASVDTATDNLIQQTLRQHFVDSTVITIAHRITSVLDSDMVLLLDHGLVEEYDTPTRLLENKSSSFAKLVAEYTVRSNSSLENVADT
ncbi:ABC transporter C family member 3 [Vitis vinifera]|uniref:ABC-type xenobiotic transporter n=1 Tax=Vitis vinifera TaxID=29760 RepID=A0A438ER64_VITVI|nr:ABC transporter C family member 3 [Vitis vinifera]